jgi:UDP-N-acetylmuramoylalanine--D-glutamate ligase
MRILGKGKTALAICEVYPDAIMYDDNDKEQFDISSDEQTVVSPGIPPHNYLVQNSKNPISDYDLFLNESQFTIWISGTNGKTTTTSMLYHLLKEDGFACGGNIGIPLAKISKEKKAILETSSFTLHYTSKVKPNIYILLPISEDHIYWHGSFKEYENAKLKPLTMMKKNDIAIIPAKYKEFQTNATVYTYDNTVDIANQFKIDISQINFKEPFLQDAVLAMAVTKLYSQKIDYEKINSFIQDPHKLEEFQDKSGNIWVDDSKATNIDATIQALKTYKDNKINLILGGDDKGVDLNPLFQEIVKYDVVIFAIGSNTDKLIELSKKYNLESISCYRLEEAVKQIIQNLKLTVKNAPGCKIQNSINMLSPAAASLDQFNSYVHRGTEFKKLILK